MTDEELDQRISQLLLRRAPPDRDALFRIKVLERRERQRLRRNMLQLVGSLLAITVAVVAAAGTSGDGEELDVMRVGVLAVAAIVAATLYVPLFVRLLRTAVLPLDR